MIRTRRAQPTALVLCLMFATPAAAQSAQPLSLQVSGLVGAITFRDTLQPGAGVEAQLRVNRVLVSDGGVLSMGIGWQYTHHAFAASRFSMSLAYSLNRATRLSCRVTDSFPICRRGSACYDSRATSSTPVPATPPAREPGSATLSAGT